MKIRTEMLLAATLIICALASSWITVQTGHSQPADPGADIARQISFITGFTSISKRVLPAVVSISSSKAAQSSEQASPPHGFSDPLFRQFFHTTPEQREQSVGSGVIVNSDGYVLTNNHLIAGADEILISLADKRELKGRIVGTDPKTDIAILKMNARGLPVVRLGDSSVTQVGEFALAVGNSFGIGQTVTMGIISATGRGGLGLDDYEDFIQTDAPVNPGNSGGALVNVRGELIGINTAIVAGNGGGNQGVGFAVPVNMARSVMDEILKHGKVIRGWLGVSLQPVTQEIAQAFGFAGQPRGGLVSDVTRNSPAERCGINKGDIILDLNGAQVGDSQELRVKIAMLAPGTIVKLKLFHEGRERDIVVTLGESPIQPEAPASPTGHLSRAPGTGLSVDSLTPEIAQQLGVPPKVEGVVVSAVTPGSAADRGGVLRGDVIQEVDRQPVTSIDGFEHELLRKGTESVLLFINRRGAHLYSVVPAR
jgi:serine protease Do